MTAISGTGSAGLPKLLQQLASFDRDGLARINKATAEEAKRQITEGFRSGVSPYGRPWPALTSRMGQPLRKTGRLQNSFTYAIRGDTSFSIGTNVQYAGTHQWGATIVPRRARRLAFQVQNVHWGPASR